MLLLPFGSFSARIDTAAVDSLPLREGSLRSDIRAGRSGGFDPVVIEG